MKPISTVPRALDTVDVATGEPAMAINQRSDVCAVPAAGVVAEAMVALVLADAVAREVRRRLGRRDPRATSRGLPRPSLRRSGDGAASSSSSGRRARARRTVGARSSPTGSASAFRDTDADVEAAAGKPIADIFVDDGEAHFRALERGRGRAALAEHDGVLASAAARCSTPGTRDAAGRPHRRASSTSASRTPPGGSG